MAAVESARDLDYRCMPALALSNLGLTRSNLGAHEQARPWPSGPAPVRLGAGEDWLALSREALAGARRAGNPLLVGEIPDQIGITFTMRGSIDEARDAWREAVQVLSEVGSSTADEVRAELRGVPDSLPRRAADDQADVAESPSR
ncbi:hypothetical protein [Streptomyces sp. RKAG293]|uniref:hypothetical protein n=1 Tax=Streptomyces sp. RKAG293 TaxID=2893403 RepID=UPI0020342A0C|nr:hypothetical protein [Streptomyces sp. RKAG293]MCM2420606.1 hypothetical protein [Streptomyces sp. RKAG293]